MVLNRDPGLQGNVIQEVVYTAYEDLAFSQKKWKALDDIYKTHTMKRWLYLINIHLGKDGEGSK